jgi:hypothetical protein
MTCFGVSQGVYAQNKNAIPDGEIYKLKGGRKVIGKTISKSSQDISVETFWGDTANILKSRVSKHFESDEIDVYKNGKYNLKKGWKLHHEVGFFADHIHSEFTFSKPIGGRVDLGVGLGHHFNSFSFASAVDWHFIEVHSIPFYAKGRFYFNKGSVRLFAEGKFGYAINIPTNSTPTANNGIVMDAGLGVYFATSYRIRHSVAIKQYALTASGEARNWSDEAISNITFSDFQFNTIVLSYSIEFGK